MVERVVSGFIPQKVLVTKFHDNLFKWIAGASLTSRIAFDVVCSVDNGRQPTSTDHVNV